MSDSLQTRKSKKKAPKKPENVQERPEKRSREKQEKLKDLDNYIETVLEDAGEDFLNRFKQIEGQ